MALYHPSMVTALSEFRTERARVTSNGHRPPRTPLLTVVARWAGRRLPALAAVRTAAMQWSGAAAGIAAVYFQWGLSAGLAGASLWLFVAAQAHTGLRQ